MAELKTKATDASVDDFLNTIKDEQTRQDCQAISEMMQQATKAAPKMWGPAIIGFGNLRYKYPNGKEMDWMQVAFSPRKQNITLYIATEFEERDDLLAKLGNHSCGKSCVYIKRLSDVHVPTLKKLIKASVKHMLKTYPPDKK